MNKLNVLSIPVNTGSYSQFVQTLATRAQTGQGGYTCVANVHMLVEAYKDKRFAQVVKNATYVAPDGKPIVWAMRLLYGIRQQRVAGMELLPDLLQQAEAKNLSVFFYGGSDALLQKTKEHLRICNPWLKVAGLYSPPYRPLTPAEEGAIAEEINASGASLVFVVLGCPKQEKWMAGMRGKITAMMVGIGGALPVMVGQQKRAPGWMQRAGLEWFFRLVQEPQRLFKRYAVTNSLFLFLLIKAYLQKITSSLA